MRVLEVKPIKQGREEEESKTVYKSDLHNRTTVYFSGRIVKFLSISMWMKPLT